jgi:eukaryotic-like serine/threonine-protein kinase
VPQAPHKSQSLADLAAKERAAALLGAVISGRYKIVELIAMGGVGAVYLGEHVKMHKHVAIKVLHPDTQEMPDITARFEREAVAGAHVSHPNVAAATDFGELPDGTHFLVLEYVRGATLRDVIKRGPLPVARAVSIAKQIAAALSATHAVGIVHRDVKPRNVMLIEGGRDTVKLIDFGLAKLSLKEVSDVAASRASMTDHLITGTGAVFGTIAYLAPEATLGMDAVDARADLYALGLVLYEMIAGKHPFDTSDPVGLFKHHARTPPPPIAERSPGVFVAPAVEAVIAKLLAKRRDDRYGSADEVIAALDAAYDGGSITPTPSPVSIGERGVFPGPSLLPPPPSVPPSAAAAPPPASVPPSAPSATAPSAVHDVVPEARATRARWPIAAGVIGVAMAGAAVVIALQQGAGSASGTMPASTGVASAKAAAPPAASAAAAPSASAAPSVSASAAPSAAASAPPPSFDPSVTRAVLRRATATRDLARAVEAFEALASYDAAAFKEPAIALAARDLASAVALTGGEGADRVFDGLAHKLGPDGLDVLYEIVRLRGGSKGAARAEALLREPGAMDRATPALRVTFALHEAPCADKPALFDKAIADGDVRTLMEMETRTKACFGAGNRPLQAAIGALRAKAR